MARADQSAMYCPCIPEYQVTRRGTQQHSLLIQLFLVTRTPVARSPHVRMLTSELVLGCVQVAAGYNL
eukprot:CAMPEP_0204567246 /NCGR_PEP_ID=MMETSP0661-20131031/36487_1 /ASSEMBLY_ACC=CAM_ASM_000606 /TAXON_ID=109239 /ORGANISM="Alexandrium margalefi, Strain AMGDE01CS-322" /LENGTH=67 /DNA_ID=CAMNT_0051575143 /DNA_START=367 /DNA_END=570 /DNA_ORIENTATION=-